MGMLLTEMKNLLGLREGSETGLAAGAIIIAKDTKRCLITLRSDKCEEPNTWCGVGGGVEKGEEIIPGLKRELEEEIGFTGNIELEHAYTSKRKNFEFHNHFGFVEKEFEPKLNDEHTDSKWVTLEELKSQENMHYGITEFMEAAPEGFEKHMKVEEEVDHLNEDLNRMKGLITSLKKFI